MWAISKHYHPNRKHTKKHQCQHLFWIPVTLIPANTTTVCRCGSETETPSCLSCIYCKDHLAPQHSLAELSDSATQQKQCYLHNSGTRQQRSSSKGWTPFVKQGRKKSKRKGWIRQHLHFLPLKDKNWVWLCITSLLHHSSASQQTLW